MLDQAKIGSVPGRTFTSAVLIVGICIGALIGNFAPSAGEWLGNGVDYSLWALVGLLFFGVRFNALFQALKNIRFLAIALFANFIVVPLIGYGIASLFLSAHPLFMVGLVVYFMSPCTDWFLSFTRLSGGNAPLGTTLIPINMTVQLLLYPFFLQWFTQNTVQLEAAVVYSSLLQWFLLPLVIAILAHQLLRLVLKSERFDIVLERADQFTPWLTALLVMQIFAGNISTILENSAVFIWLLLAVFLFFLLTFLLGEGLSRAFRLQYPDHALLTMTIAARNAPLMLAVTTAALPDQPLIYSALIIGMLVEFPHLTALRRLLLRRSGQMTFSSVNASAR